jgi:hypothetical protein
MNLERSLKLIELLAADRAWEAVVLIGRELLDSYYPADIFVGAGDSGPQYVVALREALARIDEATNPK